MSTAVKSQIKETNSPLVHIARVSQPTRVRWIKLFDLLIVLLISIFMCLYNTGTGSFGAGDQTTHSLVVQDMLKNGNYITPVYDGRAYYNKPPFKMWLANIPVWFLGESNFSYRVIDGLSGVALSVLVFFFALELFASRAIAYASVISLLGCHVLFYGHGIRNAVQDGFMLFLMSLGTVLGWKLVCQAEQLVPDSRRTTALAFWGGVTIGLAALTKNVAGYFAFVIVGIYCLLSGQALSVIKRIPKKIFLAIVLSLLLPAVYILAQGENRYLAFHMLLITEVFKRATKGYHFVNQPWYYFEGILQDRVAVPPELLVIATISALYFALKMRDQRYIFLLSWAYVPLILQSAMKSKLMWYILPSIPGMSLLVGVFLGKIFSGAANELRNYFVHKRLSLLKFAFPAFISIYSLIAIGYNWSKIAEIFLFSSRRNASDLMVDDIKRHFSEIGDTARVLRFDPPKLARHETFYWNMLPVQDLKEEDWDRAEKLLEDKQVDFLITKLANFPKVATARAVAAYSFLPPRNRRRSWLAVLSYRDDFLPRTFTALSREYLAGTEDISLAFGWKSAIALWERNVHPSNGSKSAVIINAGLPQETFGAEFIFNIASVIPVKNGKGLSIDVFLNDQKITILQNIPEGFHEHKFDVPAEAFKSGSNLLTFVYRLPDHTAVGPEQQTVLLNSFRQKTITSQNGF